MKRCLLFLTVVASLALTSGAAAKEASKATVCGASGCHETSDKSTLAGLWRSGSDVVPPSSGAPFYHVTFTVRHGDATDLQRVDYLPSRGLVRNQDPTERGTGAWVALDSKAAALYRELIGDLQPFAASKLGEIGLPQVRVDEVVTQPAPPAPDESGFPWLIVALAAGGLLVVGTVTARLSVADRARRSGPRARRSSTSASQSSP